MRKADWAYVVSSTIILVLAIMIVWTAHKQNRNEPTTQIVHSTVPIPSPSASPEPAYEIVEYNPADWGPYRFVCAPKGLSYKLAKAAGDRYLFLPILILNCAEKDAKYLRIKEHQLDYPHKP